MTLFDVFMILLFVAMPFICLIETAPTRVAFWTWMTCLIIITLTEFAIAFYVMMLQLGMI